MALVLALAGGSTIFLVFLILLVLGAAFSIYGKRGSNIDAHPMEGDASPGSGMESGVQDPDESEFRSTFDDRGSR